jgi:hypothetical protein
VLDAKVVEADTDTDGDGLDDLVEVVEVGTDHTVFDTDTDLLSDGFEYGSSNGALDPLSPDDAEGDFDEDGLSELEEQINGTDPGSNDSDQDGVNDATETEQGSDPNDPSDGGAAPPAEDVGKEKGSERKGVRTIYQKIVLTPFLSNRSIKPIRTIWVRRKFK